MVKVFAQDGNTVEFWLKKGQWLTTTEGDVDRTQREVVLDVYTVSSVSSSSDYGRLRVELTGTATVSTAALVFGGRYPPSSAVGLTEKYDGTSWTETSNLNTARKWSGGAGSSTAALNFGGQPESEPTATSVRTETWDGTSWSQVGELNQTRLYLAGAGTNTAALAIGGSTSDPTAVGNTESWNGTSWVEVADLATARGLLAAGGTTSTAFAAGGTTNAGTPGDTDATEEWNLVNTVKTVTVS